MAFYSYDMFSHLSLSFLLLGMGLSAQLVTLRVAVTRSPGEEHVLDMERKQDAPLTVVTINRRKMVGVLNMQQVYRQIFLLRLQCSLLLMVLRNNVFLHMYPMGRRQRYRLIQ